MSTKIRLTIHRRTIPDLAEYDVQGLRFLCLVSFKSAAGYTKPQWGIVDTGAPISVVPRRIWSSLPHERLKDYEIRGIVPKEECAQPVCFGAVTCRLLDEEGETGELTIRADLAYTDDLPIILGLLDLLEKAVIHTNCRRDVAYLQI